MSTVNGDGEATKLTLLLSNVDKSRANLHAKLSCRAHSLAVIGTRTSVKIRWNVLYVCL